MGDKLTIDDVLFNPRWRRVKVGVYNLVAEYIRDTPDVCAVVRGSGRVWKWQTYTVWTNTVDGHDDDGSAGSKRSAQRCAERRIVEVLGADPSPLELAQQNIRHVGARGR